MAHDDLGFSVAGFPADQYLRLPLEFLDHHLSRYSPSEVVVLLYILRRTIGWQKVSDAISLKQFTDGIPGVDTGTGLSKNTVCRALDHFTERGILTRQHGAYADGGHAPTRYVLHWQRVVAK